jgi:hypothetical protein
MPNASAIESYEAPLSRLVLSPHTSWLLPKAERRELPVIFTNLGTTLDVPFYIGSLNPFYREKYFTEEGQLEGLS